MLVSGRALLAGVLSASLTLELPGVAAGSMTWASHVPSGQVRATIGVSVARPIRIDVKEPVRVKPVTRPASAIRPKLVHGVRPAFSQHVSGPPMLRPSEISGGVEAARRASSAHVQQAVRVQSLPIPARALPIATQHPARFLTPQAVQNCNPTLAVVRKLQTVVTSPTPDPGTPTPCPPTSTPVPQPTPTPGPTGTATPTPAAVASSGTGINPWWRYQEENVPGGGHVMVNVGTGNMLLQDDDMSVPHKGIELAFRRTYNSQASAATLPTAWGNFQSLYGNGWTNTFDARFVSQSATIKSVYDIDGARYDYAYNGSSTMTSLTPGQHATMVFDGGCGWLWTKKSGTTYYFYTMNPNAAVTCPSLGRIGGYSGRLYQIIGRNHNTSITFSYAWDNNDASATGKIAGITATTESGQTASLSFADFSGRRLLQQLTFPDGATTVSYGYDAFGNLSSVSSPPNNSAGTRPQHWYGYNQSGSDYVLSDAASPRWAAACSVDNCGGDGAYLGFAFVGIGAASSMLSSIQHFALVNPTIPDGTAGVGIQAGYPTYAYAYLTEYYTTGVGKPTFRDSSGHMIDWVVDSAGRPTQTQECTASTGQGTQCTGTWLITNETWDANNNFLAVTDSRGYETDSAYDANGNTIAVAGPSMNTSLGTFRPTSLYSYDAFNNVIAYCDPVATHSAIPGGDWTVSPTPPPPQGPGLCPQSSISTRYQWVPTADEQFGELISSTRPGTPASANGYKVTYSYARQNGIDYGLPSAVQGDPVSQIGGAQAPSQVTPTQTFRYDNNGNPVCYFNGVGTWAIQYDLLGRAATTADPDDSSIAGCNKPASAYATGSYKAYFPDGSVSYIEDPTQHAADVASSSKGAAVSYSYDLDGDVLTETHHHGCAAISACTPGVTTKWYDGADRLVEVMKPYDPQYDYHSYRWLTRYLYDLTSTGTVNLTASASSTTSGGNTSAFPAYGNLYDIQEFVDLGWSTNDSAPRWVDHLGTSYDAIDRKLASYDVSANLSPRDVYAYDQTPSTRGFQSTHTKPTGEVVSSDYDAAGRLASVNYSMTGPAPVNAAGGVPSRTYTYDPRGGIASIDSALGTETYTYDAEGRRLTDREPSGAGGNTISVAYAANGWRSSLSVSGAINSTLFQYSYQADGRLAQERVNNGGWKTFTWQTTPAGRLQQRSDPTTAQAVHEFTFGGVPNSSGTSNAFMPLSYGYNRSGMVSNATYSDGVVVNGITSDLEGNQSYATYVGNYNSEPNPVTARGENVGALSHGIPAAYANGIRLPAGPTSGTPPAFYRGGDRVNPVALIAYGSDGIMSAYHPLDGFELSTTGQSYTGTYSNAFAYDPSGRLSSSDLQQCTNTDSSGNFSSSESAAYYSYDAEDHLISEITGSTPSAPNTCVFGAQLANNETYSVSWGTNGHPISVAHTTDNTYLHGVAVYHEYLHWDGDSLLFTSSTPSGGPDNVKVAGIAEFRPTDGVMQVYDRDAAGDIWDTHNTTQSTQNGGFNDMYGRFGGTLAGPNPAPSLGNISEPRPENVSGWGTFAIQGVRGVDSGLSHWTTPDAFAGTIHDPASQKPYVYEGNNSYAYSDPSGFCSQRIGGPPEDCRQKPSVSTARQAAELRKLFNLGELDGKFFLPTILSILGLLGGGEGRAAKGAEEAAVIMTEAGDRGIMVGKRGMRPELEFTGNVETKIGPYVYSAHALNRMQGRGFLPMMIEDIIANPTQITPGKGGAMFYSNSLGRVLLNDKFKIVSVWAQ